MKKSSKTVKLWIPAFAGMTMALLALLALLFSTWLMFHTFSFDVASHSMRIGYKLWSDFGAQIPLIRSFSMGKNFPIEYPVYAGAPIRYHFIFFLLVGLLEKMGLRIDFALNIPSIIGFTALLVGIFLLASKLTKSKPVAILSIIFFLFNGSLGFLRFFMQFPLSLQTPYDIVHAMNFPAFAPWGPGDVTAFWNLNIYTNQRHLAAAFALAIFFMLTILHIEKQTLKKQLPWALFWGITIGILPYFHQPTLLIFAVLMSWYFLAFPGVRKMLYLMGVIGLILVIPQISALHGQSSVQWYPGFIIHNELMNLGILKAIPRFLLFWWQNFGAHSVLIPLGFLILPTRAKKLLFPLLPIFIIANLAKFSVEASANHKFFNFVLITGNICSAYALTKVFNDIRHFSRHWIIGVPARHRYLPDSASRWQAGAQALAGGFAYLFIGLFVLLLTFSGVIDFFVVANDTKGSIVDIPKNEIATWISKNTPPDAVFLNSSYLYHPASIAGRKIFLGWPYFAWSAGYPIDRMPILRSMYETRSTSQLCAMLTQYNISYMTAENVKNDPNLPNIDLSYYLKTYSPVFVSKDRKYAIFHTAEICK